MKFVRIVQLVLMLPLMMVAIGYSLPSYSDAEGEITINAEPKIIYQLINKPEHHLLWAPWLYNPPKPIKIETTGTIQDKGATLSWISNDRYEPKNGSTTITSSIPYKFITGDLLFNKLPSASYKFTIFNNKANTQARVLFQYQSIEQGPFDRLIAAVFGNSIQSDLDVSLFRLKSIAEAETANQQIAEY